ncbi:CLUMA_CG000302, isoform A [Clunio marinus]|uniref:CLUMA_CG000302, isoform A n=1 Tax=Clunio marinus TaxID=568069 RepID=A0A1J1HF10_9DIPT|nr:CLUMA_CG000302, isoform A [Clunio marinus]
MFKRRNNWSILYQKKSLERCLQIFGTFQMFIRQFIRQNPNGIDDDIIVKLFLFQENVTKSDIILKRRILTSKEPKY